MNREDLLKMLDLTGKETSSEPAGELTVTRAEAVPPVSASPTALDLDGWALRKGGEVLGESERLRGLDLGEHAIADFFGAAFLPDPQLLPACADPRRHEFVAQMLGVRRAGVSETAAALQERGLIEAGRMNLRVTDPTGLGQAACECFRVLRDEYDRLLGPMLKSDG